MTTNMLIDNGMQASPVDLKPHEIAQIFRDLRELNNACSKDHAHDRATVLIKACIDSGINTRARIRGVL